MRGELTSIREVADTVGGIVTLWARTWFGQFRELVMKPAVRNIERVIEDSQPLQRIQHKDWVCFDEIMN
jgi:hypothetical protein